MGLLPNVILLVLTALAVNAVSRNDNLVAVVQLFRHGQRTPAAFYTNDPYANRSYWGGLDVGQLTNEGKRQHYDLGQFTRRRYRNWLPLRYDKDIFNAQTTDVDRTHMSGQANLNGLFPARRDQVWRKFSDWQPIPLHPAQTEIFNSIALDCSAYLLEWMSILYGDDYRQINEDNAELFEFLTNKSGDSITDFFGTQTVFDCLRIEEDVGLPLPNWAPEVYPQPLYDLGGWMFESFSHNTKLQRLGTGPFLYTILEFFDSMIEDSTSNPKYQLYSGHDSNIAQTLNTLGAFDPPYPPAFASTIYIELRQNTTGENFINVWSKNGDDFRQVSIRGCELDCPLEEARERLSDVLVDVESRNTECSTSAEDKSQIGQKNYKLVMKRLQELKKRFE